MSINGFPLPIFVAHNEYNNAQNKNERFRSGMRLFTTALKYCSISAIAEYLDFLEKGGEPDTQLTNLLYSNLFRPSLGHWNHFLRDLLVFRRKRIEDESEGFFHDLDRVYFKKRNKTTPGKLAVIFNELISIRNEWFHPGLDPDENNAPGLLTEVDDKIKTMLEHLDFLKNYPLFHFQNDSRQELMGDLNSTWTEDEVEKLSPQERQLHLNIGNEYSIPLNFLIELKNSSNGTDNHFMLFETARINRKKSIKLVKFILGNQWGFDEKLYLDLANEVQKLLRIEQVEEVSDVTELSWPHLYSVSQNLLKENRRDLEESGKVIPSLYIRRSKIEGDAGIFEQFLEDKKSHCLLILGDSGHGKTNTLWKLITHPLLREKKDDLAIFFLEARNIHPSGLRHELDQNLYLENTLPALQKLLHDKKSQFADKEVIIIIDAVNEYASPAGLMREILDLYNEGAEIKLRFIISCRTVSWSRILVTLTSQQEERVFSFLEDSDKHYPTLAEYTSDELDLAYENYCNNFHISTKLDQISPRAIKLIKDPLMLRLTTEAYSGTENEPGQIPQQLNIPTIFETYDKKAQIDVRRDEPFLAELIENMWNNQHSTLSGESVRQQHNLQEIVYALPINLAPGSTYQCSSCKSIFKLGDPNFNIDDPCAVCDSMTVKPVQKDWRTTYERLLDEGIITEDHQADDIALRFVYDRYFEYRTSCWILNKFAPLDKNVVSQLVKHAHLGDAPILLEAIKLAVRMCDKCESIVIELAGSEDQELKDMAESITIGLSMSAKAEKAERIIGLLVGGSPSMRIIAINIAVEVPEVADFALLKEIPKKEGTEIISQALSRALYLIWRNDPERAAGIMEELRQQITYSSFIKHGFNLFSVLLEVTFKTLGVMHHKENIVKTLGEFWIKLITQNLRLAKKGLFNGLLSKSVKFTLINSLSLFGNTLFKKHGVSFGKGDNAFREDEKKAILTLLDAWEPGSDAVKEVTDIMLKFGPDSLQGDQKDRICSTIAVFFAIPACVAAMFNDPEKTIEIYNDTFSKSADLNDRGRTTRFFTYSGVNFALQLNYPKLNNSEASEHPLEPVYGKLHSWFLELLETDPDIFTRAEIIDGTPNSSFGIFSQACSRMGHDLVNDLVEPMLKKAESGYPGLLKSYLRTSLFSLDTFSQRVSAHLSVLRTYDHLLNIPDLAIRIGIDKAELNLLFIEAFAVISLGYPSDVELFVINNKNIPSGFMELVRQARNKPSKLFDQSDKQTLEQYINSTLQAWTISDGGNSMLANFPALRGIIDKYFRDAVACGDLADVLSQAVKDLFNFLLDQGKNV